MTGNRARRLRRKMVVVTIVAAATIGFISGPAPGVRADMRALLVDAIPATHRALAPRLTGGFPWAPYVRGVSPSPSSDERVTLLKAVHDVSKRVQAEPTFRNQHAWAIAQILSDRPQDGMRILETLAESSRSDAAVWSDFAAAYLVLTDRQDDPSHLARALAAADAALRIDRLLPEARFNRALILEALGLRDEAGAAWTHYLAVDARSEWSAEARKHIFALRPVTPFRTLFEQSYDRLTSDDAMARQMARDYPEEARRYGETLVLWKWAVARREKTAAAAAGHLRLARLFGAELAARGGDRMLASLVAAIDRADPIRLEALVRAHIAFREGQTAYRQDRIAEAQRRLDFAAVEFERGRSPGSLLARYFASNTRFDQGAVEEAEGRLRGLLSTAPAEYPAHRAQVLWQLGTVALSQSRWGACIDSYTESVRVFERLGEQSMAASVRENLVEAYDRIGNPSVAWKHRMLALRTLGIRADMRLQLAISSVSRAAAIVEEWPIALSFLHLEIATLAHVDDPLLLADTLLRRAQIEIRLQHGVAAASDLAGARKVISTLRDSTHRAHMKAIADSVEAALARDPAVAVALLSGAIDFHRSGGRRLYVPELLLERARAFRVQRQEARAIADVDAAIAELETHRGSVAQGEDRWGFFHGSEQLFTEAIDLALEVGDVRRAFLYAERARARSLLESLGVAWPRVEPEDIGAGTAVVEYTISAERLVIFVVDRGGVRAIRHRVSRRKLTAEMAAFAEAVRRDDLSDVRRHGRQLYQRLVEPIEPHLSQITTLAFVPDPTMVAIPFAALTASDGKYLVEHYASTAQPSAAVFARLARQSGRRERLLIVRGSDRGQFLAASEREVARIAQLYDPVVELKRGETTPSNFARLAREADVVHFAGHGIASQGDGRPALLLLNDTAEGELDFHVVASMRLSRTSLVVLGACATAAGETRSTEGTISIARGFLAAGVPGVVATLWPIDDELAARFFPRLHEHLARGLTPADAVRATQLDAIHRRDPPVSLWAAVQLIGE